MKFWKTNAGAHLLPALNVSTAARRSSQPAMDIASSQHSTRQWTIRCPKCVRSPSRYRFANCKALEGIPSAWATSSTHIPATTIPCGPPKSRYAVLDAWLVRQRRPCRRTAGMLNAQSECKSDRSIIACLRSTLLPAAVMLFTNQKTILGILWPNIN